MDSQKEKLAIKFNKRERLALAALKEIVFGLENGKVVHISTPECNALDEVFGIKLKKITTPKTQIRQFKRGKAMFRIEIHSPFPSHWNMPNRYGYFPFQIKEKKQ